MLPRTPLPHSGRGFGRARARTFAGESLASPTDDKGFARTGSALLVMIGSLQFENVALILACAHDGGSFFTAVGASFVATGALIATSRDFLLLAQMPQRSVFLAVDLLKHISVRAPEIAERRLFHSRALLDGLVRGCAVLSEKRDVNLEV